MPTGAPQHSGQLRPEAQPQPHPLQPTAVNRWTDPSLGLSRALQRLLGGREREQGQTQLHLLCPSPPPSKAGKPSSLRASSLLPVVEDAPHEA